MLLTRTTRPAVIVAATAAMVALAACGGGDSGGGEPGAQDMDPETCGPSGNLTVLTWRTDLVEDGTFDDYVATFKEAYPDIGDVSIQGITDYEGEVKTRMSTDDYGDVLAIPGSVTPDQFSQFFEPLGELSEMQSQYRWLEPKTYEGLSYGIPVVGNVMGAVYNIEVFENAGVTDFATTPEEFLADLEAVQATDPDIAPLYTNYKDGWPLTAWQGYVGGVSGDPEYNNAMTADEAPWSGGGDIEVIDGLLYDLVAQGLSEADPTTTNWEQSKQMLATGQIGVMMLGSWAIPQMQDAAEAAGESRDIIGYMPFPAQSDGTFYAVAGGDYNLGINVHSSNKCAARAWIDWFNHESGFSESQVGLSPLVDGPVPESLQAFMETVELVEMAAAPEGQESLFSDIDNESGIVTTSPDYRMKLVDDARSGARTKQQVFDDLNTAWGEAVQAVSAG